MERSRILIIEDDPTITKFLSVRLAEQGYRVCTASDGLTGLTAARTQFPDLILLDLGLPGLSGEEVCKAIREDENKRLAQTPIIMLTGKRSDVDRVIGCVIGADAYLTKPYNAEELLKEIGKWVGNCHER